MEAEVYQNNLSEEIKHYLQQHSSHSVFELIIEKENKKIKCSISGKFADNNIDWEELINFDGYKLFVIYTYDELTEVLISSYAARKFLNILNSEYLTFSGEFIVNSDLGWVVVEDIDIC